jgi:hypothetical protein
MLTFRLTFTTMGLMDDGDHAFSAADAETA